jgi:carbon storage regulator CsrA
MEGDADMLVLSRRNKEVIRFPEVGISVEILRIKGSTVRVGIDAPVEISVVRGELDDRAPRQTIRKISLPGGDDHKLRNQLNSLTIASALIKKLVEAGRTSEACSQLEAALGRLEEFGKKQPENNGLTALLVEDAPNEREMLAGFLRLHGYQVETVSDGLEALEYLNAGNKPNLILMDMNLPNCDGSTTIRRIRENPQWNDVLIFAVSGMLPQEAGVEPKRDRVTEWFQKPLQPSDLIKAINQVVPTTAA